MEHAVIMIRCKIVCVKLCKIVRAAGYFHWQQQLKFRSTVQQIINKYCQVSHFQFICFVILVLYITMGGSVLFHIKSDCLK